MSVWKTAMMWLGFGPDVDYDPRADEQGRATGDPGLRQAAGASTAIGTSPSPAAADFSAVRSLGPMSTDAEYDPAGDAGFSPHEPLSNTSLRPAAVDLQTGPPVGSVRAMPTTGAKPQVVSPRSFNEAQEIADRFRGGAPVVLNLRETDVDLGRRLIDFCSGLCYGLRGSMSKAGDRVFLVVPNDVSLTPEDLRILSESGLVS